MRATSERVLQLARSVVRDACPMGQAIRLKDFNSQKRQQNLTMVGKIVKNNIPDNTQTVLESFARVCMIG